MLIAVVLFGVLALAMWSATGISIIREPRRPAHGMALIACLVAT